MSQKKDPRRGLGRGLSALLGDVGPEAAGAPSAAAQFLPEGGTGLPRPARSPRPSCRSTGSTPTRRSRGAISTRPSSRSSPPRSASAASSSR
jgi:hypothetical protein